MWTHTHTRTAKCINSVLQRKIGSLTHTHSNSETTGKTDFGWVVVVVVGEAVLTLAAAMTTVSLSLWPVAVLFRLLVEPHTL